MDFTADKADGVRKAMREREARLEVRAAVLEAARTYAFYERLSKNGKASQAQVQTYAKTLSNSVILGFSNIGKLNKFGEAPREDAHIAFFLFLERHGTPFSKEVERILTEKLKDEEYKNGGSLYQSIRARMAKK